MMAGQSAHGSASADHPVALWGGVECTINRLGDAYFSQLDRNGHATRMEDLDAFAALGIRAIRYPVLWEAVAPHGLDEADWSWTDARLQRLRELGVEPIAGLVHHGSGPRDTSLLDPSFPEKLAAYAAAVSRRYPWLDRYTPVNEPLTTARFSALYGVWYPHARDEASFKDALFNQCRAVVLSMREIQKVNPSATLLQTEDLGFTYSGPALAYQAEFHNQLRWLSWDLLCGRVDEQHPMWEWLTRYCRATPREILWFAENPRPPDLVCANYYVTSERFLDAELHHYPARLHGGNGRHRYVDVEAARVLGEPSGGIGPLLEEAWQRYGLPIAVTEAHIDARRDDQLRWLAEIWNGIAQARARGADVRAMTVWSLLGAFDWNSLLVSQCGYYESGAFDVRGGRPRATAVAGLMGHLSQGRLPENLPALSAPGWWRRPGRFLRPPVAVPRFSTRDVPVGHNESPLLITGANGTLGRAFARLCADRGLACRLVTRGEMDIGDVDAIERALDEHAPWAVINTAGYVRVDDAEQDAERCYRENTLGASRLASACARHGLPLVTFSSDLVFDGRQQAPYVETDAVSPLSVYGRSKADAEQQVLALHPQAMVVRTSAFFGPWDRHNFVTQALRALRDGVPFRAAHDLTISPTYVPDLVNACLDLLIDGEGGVLHLSNGQPVTWAQLALRAAECAGVDPWSLQPCASGLLGHRARRPVFSALASARVFVMPSLDDALLRYVGSATTASFPGQDRRAVMRSLQTNRKPAPVHHDHGRDDARRDEERTRRTGSSR